MEMPHLSEAQALILHPPIFAAAFLGLRGSPHIRTACLVKSKMNNIQSEMAGQLVSWQLTVMCTHAELIMAHIACP